MRRTTSWSIVLSLACLVSWVAVSQEPLFIYGEENLAAFMQGLPGNGTELDPYRLSLRRIDIERGDYGIWLENIDSHLIVERCDISGVVSPTSVGAIVLRNCRNVVIRECHVHNNRAAIILQRCENVHLENNALIDNEYGIMLDMFSQNNTFIANRLDNRVNATATRPNTWSLDGIGNCWSNGCLDNTAFTISPWNRDYNPASLCECPFPEDITPPVLPPEFSDSLPIEKGTDLTELAKTICAWDDRDGDIACVLDFGNINPCIVGSDQTVILKACDESGNCAEKIIPIRIVDTTPPQIRFIMQDPFILEMGTPPTSLLAVGEVTDVCAGHIALEVDFGRLDVCTPGEYEVTFFATDTSANVNRTRKTVRVVDTQPPHIEMLGENPWLVELEAPIRDADPGIAISESCNCEFLGSVNSDYEVVVASEPGIYEITYRACDTTGNCATAVRQVVVGLGPPPPIGSVSPLDATYNEWTMEDQFVRCVIELRDVDSAPYLNQLYSGAILKAIALQVPTSIDLPIFFEFVSGSAQSVLVGRLLPHQRTLLNEESTALDVLLASEIVDEQFSQAGDFRTPSSELTDARSRAESVVRYYAEGPSAVLIKAHVASYDLPIQFFVDASYFKSWDISQALHDVLSDQTRAIALMIQKALHGYTGVAISAFDEEYGLLYRGIILTDAADWVEAFVHPSI